MNAAIVTGATGFIGSAFVKYLIDKGIKVLALGRKEFHDINKTRRVKLKGAKYLNINMASIKLLPSQLEAIEWNPGNECVFFNLAWHGENRLSDLSVEAQLLNVSYSIDAIEIANTLGCNRFIQIGTMEEAFTEKYLDLDHNIDSFYNRHVIYSIAKLSAKNALYIKASQLEIDLYVLHSHVMGPDDDKDSFLQMTLLKLINGDDLIFSSGEQYFDVISLNDCALGYFLICMKGVPGKTYWVGSGKPQRLRNYVERMYDLYPSNKSMQFGKLPYNDIVLEESDFSIATLVEDTGFIPTMTYEETVNELHSHLISLI
jgi:nucleoside-diphosphate-sugar epimerase